MTIGAAWVRKAAGGEELWIASDSRLTGDGYAWDNCPKLLPLPRRDAVAGFSGGTRQAYPLMLQMANAIGSYRPAADGTLEFLDMTVHLEHIANAMMTGLKVDPAITGAQMPRREFATSGDALVLGGYSRKKGGMVIRVLRYQGPSSDRWKFERVRPSLVLGSERVIAIFGDNAARSRFRYLLKVLLQERGTLSDGQHFDSEPLEVLARLLKMPQSMEERLPMGHRPWTVGGAPQIVRVLAGAQATAFAVRWDVAGAVVDSLLGRPTFDYERLDAPLVTFDDANVRIHAPGQWPALGMREQ